MITQCQVTPLSVHIISFFLCAVRTFKIYSLCNFQTYNPVLLTAVTMLCIRSLKLIYLNNMIIIQSSDSVQVPERSHYVLPGRSSSPQPFLTYMFLGSNTHTLGHRMCGHSPQLFGLRNPTLGSLHLLAWFCSRTDVFEKKCNWNHNLRTQVIKFTEFLRFCCSPFLEVIRKQRHGNAHNRKALDLKCRHSEEAPSVWPSPFLSFGSLHEVLCIRTERIQVTFMNGHYVAPVV